jgi:exonuclease SbcC
LDTLKLELASLCERQSALGKLQSDFAVIAAKRDALTAAQSAFEALAEKYRTTKTKCDELYELFLRGQAGVLSATLESGKPCPVCGSTEHPTPADAPDEEISESKLKKLNADADKSKDKLDEKTAVCASLRAETAALTERFLRDASALFDDISLEAIGMLLADSIRQVDEELSALTIKKHADETVLSALILQTGALAKRKEEIAPQCTALKAEISTQRSRFLKDFYELSPDTTWDTAGADLATLLSKIKARSEDLTEKKNVEKSALAALKKSIDSATKKHAESESKLASARILAEERNNRVKEQEVVFHTATNAYLKALSANGFADTESYTAALITEDDLATLAKVIVDYEDHGKALRREITRLESETAGQAEPDLKKLKAEAAERKETIDKLRSGRDETKSRLDNTARIWKDLKKSAASLVKIEREYAALKGLSDTANGKLDFETYAQTAYFERVLHAANLRLRAMSQNRYVLLRREEGDDGRKRTGLEIEVADSYTGRSRSANSLSGGESFMASLSLALGLSDVVQQTAGGIHLDAMFIDEGFGSLDAEVLELSVRTLSDMAGGNRMVGIISHVAELRERIDRQVRVEKTTSGSKIRLVI